MTEAIDWPITEEKLPPGLRVRGSDSLATYKDEGIFNSEAIIRGRVGKEGILIRYGIESSWNLGHLDAIIVQFFDDPREWNFGPRDLDYLIDGQWLTFEQVMS
jgi:hypothetical protein